jgi:hypothetical protein
MSMFPALVYSTSAQPVARGRHVTRDTVLCRTVPFEKIAAVQLVGSLFGLQLKLMVNKRVNRRRTLVPVKPNGSTLHTPIIFLYDPPPNHLLTYA